MDIMAFKSTYISNAEDMPFHDFMTEDEMMAVIEMGRGIFFWQLFETSKVTKEQLEPISNH